MVHRINKQSVRFAWILSIALGLATLSCAYTPDRFHPDYQQFRRTAHHFLLMPAEVGLYTETADGKMLWQAEKSSKAEKNIGQAVLDAMEAHALDVEPVDLKGPDSSELIEIKTLFRNVNRSIQLHAFGPQEFATKRRLFDYSIGSIRELLQKSQADALILVLGHQIVSSHAPKTWLSIAVVEPNGQVAWYGMQGGREAVSLETPIQAADLVRSTLKAFLGDFS